MYRCFAILFTMLMVGISGLVKAAPHQVREEKDLTYINASPAIMDTLKAQIVQALLAQGVGKSIRISFIEKEADIMALLNNGSIETMVSEPFDIDRNTGTFAALIRFLPYGGKEEQYARIKGKYEEVVKVPVLKAKVGRGDTIHANNITWVELTGSRVKYDTVLTVDKLVGKAPKRTLVAGKPIRERLLVMPTVIHKNDRVRMVYQTPHVKIMAFGVAMDEGGQGAYIPVKNLSSDRVVNAMVEGKNQVAILPEIMSSNKVASYE